MTSQQRAKLRGMANNFEPIVHVGKDGVNENIIKQVSDALLARELIKGTVQKNCDDTVKDVCNDICDKTDAEPVQVIGRKFVIYKKNENEPKIII